MTVTTNLLLSVIAHPALTGYSLPSHTLPEPIQRHTPDARTSRDKKEGSPLPNSDTADLKSRPQPYLSLLLTLLPLSSPPDPKARPCQPLGSSS
jgi:hypothetical protein